MNQCSLILNHGSKHDRQAQVLFRTNCVAPGPLAELSAPYYSRGRDDKPPLLIMPCHGLRGTARCKAPEGTLCDDVSMSACMDVASITLKLLQLRDSP